MKLLLILTAFVEIISSLETNELNRRTTRSLHSRVYSAAQWPTIEDCGCTGELPGVNVYECEAGRCCKRASVLSEPTLDLFGPRSLHKPTRTETDTRCGERPGKLLKVVGGKVTAVESHPWIASIFWRGRSSQSAFRCGGSLISPCWVVTAAHCFPDSTQTKLHRLSIFLGKNAVNQTDYEREQKFRVDELIIHHAFDNSDGNYNNDIANNGWHYSRHCGLPALLKIIGNDGRCAEESGSVRTVCLPPAYQMLPAGVTCEIAGYGKEREGIWHNSQYLREAKVKLLSQDVCTSDTYYGKMVTNNMFCAGSPDWKTDSCKGDSGGPLVCEVNSRLFLFGIVSWGEGCSREFRPGVYTRVTKYNRWIEKKTGLSSIAAGSMYPQK